MSTLKLNEPLRDLFASSQMMILDFKQISPETPEEQNIAKFFDLCEKKGINPRLPQLRQEFNNNFLRSINKRYLVSRYGEDRRSMLVGSKIYDEGRTLHMGVDIFSENLEKVLAPCSGTIVKVDRENDDHGYGNYLIIEPVDTANLYIFMGHLGEAKVTAGQNIKTGETIAELGDYINNQNGGWSRHLHLQLCSSLPPEGETPIGYSTQAEFTNNCKLFPDPMSYFTDWQLLTSASIFGK